MQFSPLALDPRWDGHLLKFNHRGDTSSITTDVPEEPPAEMTAYAITYTSKTGQTALWQGASLELADIDDDIADANGDVDPDRIPEAPQPECPTGGCARDRAKAEAAKEEL